MDLKLKDKVVIVTGGAKGIGAAAVEIFAREDAIPVIVGRSPGTGEALLERIGATGKRGLMIETELTDVEACRSAIEKTLESFGRIDGIVHNAGVNDGVSLRAGPDDFVASLQRNLFHLYNLTHFALDALIESTGFIINVSSKLAVTGQGSTSGYAAAKGAIHGLTREWAVDLAEHGIRVNTVVPAEVWTPMYDSWIQTVENPEETLSAIRSRIPLGQRMTSAEEMGNAIVFLASSRSGHTTGQIHHIDGGYVHFDRSYGDIEKDES
ncbi:MAG: SDR family oxidoreductase [Verrucomicrobiota bacterium]|nr:SDR family oxidoreductase [Verrucomicrobiota bacterium]